MTAKKYHHLSAEERACIMFTMRADPSCSARAIARALQRSPSTISRELARLKAQSYDASQAARDYRQRRRRCRRRPVPVPDTPLYQYVHDRLVYSCWSPQQIAARLRCMHPSIRPGLVSHESIYAAIYAQPRGSLKKELIAALRQAKPSRGLRRTTAARAARFVPEQLRICHRPEEIEQRRLPGYWEGDFIKGAFNRSAVGVLVERCTGRLCSPDEKTACLPASKPDL